MLPEVKKILFASDLSLNSRYAFGYAASLADHYSAKITVLHVLERLNPSTIMEVQGYMGEEDWKKIQKEKQEGLLDEITLRLNDFCAEMNDKLIDCKFIVEGIVTIEGVPAEEVLKQSKKLDMDVIVMGTHGHGLFADALLGSTARRVINRSEIPVMAIRLPQKPKEN
jgi:nucleotide-binding universal stress UspA family protein